MKKIAFLILFFLFLLKPVSAFAQNKIGVNIGAYHNDFSKAVEMVGPGGWIVVMACPGDGDKIQKWISDYPNINLIIRGHFYPNNPDENLAKAWAATLGSIHTPNKIYFMPWNEPNQTGYGDATLASNLKQYISILIREFNKYGLLDTKIRLLSPMLNQTYACDGTSCSSNFRDYVSELGGASFFNQFYGIAMNLYDWQNCGNPLCASNPNFNASRFDEVLVQMGVPGKKVFAVESGVVKSSSVQYNDALLKPFYEAVFPSWHPKGNFIMEAVFSYDPEHEEDWDIFSSATGQLFRNKSREMGSCCLDPRNYDQSKFTTSLNLCPGKTNSYFSENEGECSDCGGESSLQSCIPVAGSDPLGEYADKPINLNETAFYSRNSSPADNACLVAEIQAKAKFDDLQIPLAKQLNRFYLGKENSQGLFIGEKPSEMGILRLLLSAEKQDALKIQYLNEIISRGPNSKYANFKVNGMNPGQIKAAFQRISKKNTKERNDYDKAFLKNVWAKLPLFANEEAEGQIILQGVDIDGNVGNVGKVRTSVPEVYRLNKASELLARLTVPGFSNNSQTSSLEKNQPVAQNYSPSLVQNKNVLPASDVCILDQPVPVPTIKKMLGGDGNQICTTLEENRFNKSSGLLNDADESCRQLENTCNMAYPKDKCCGNHGKCVDSKGDGIYTCSETCPGGENGYCIGPSGTNSLKNCCVPDFPEKSKNLEGDQLLIYNEVPFLANIEKSTVGPNGFSRIFIPNTIPTPAAFEDVAGKSLSNVGAVEPTVTYKKGNWRLVPNPQPENVNILFAKLGTMFNVGKLIGEIVSPLTNHGGTPTPPPTTLDYEIDYRNKSITISDTAKQNVINQALNAWPNSKIETDWNLVYNQAIGNNWNPAFVIALWLEESGASGVSAYDLGCLSGERNNLPSQLNCLFTRPYANQPFNEFMCMYSEGKSAPCTFTLNPNFPTNLKVWYDKLRE